MKYPKPFFKSIPSKLLLLLLFSATATIAHSQAVNKIYGNKIYLTSKGDSAEVFFDIPTKNVAGGFLYNIGNGKVVFKTVAGGTDTTKIDTAYSTNDSTIRFCKGASCWDVVIKGTGSASSIDTSNLSLRLDTLSTNKMDTAYAVNDSTTRYCKSGNCWDITIHSTALNSIDGIAAGGDLSGTYPDPSVVWTNGFPTYDVRYLPEFVPGYVTWSGTGLTFNVTAASYTINGVRYSSSAGSITLDAADATNPRYDVIALDNTGSIVKITGTAAASPSIPQVDPATQIALTAILVDAGATEPTITQNIVYDENAEAWTGTASGVTVNFDNATNVQHGSKSADVGSWSAGDRVDFTLNTGTLNASDFSSLSGFIKLKASIAGSANVRVSFLNGSTVVSNVITLNAQYGFSKSVTSYQNIAIPISAFTFTSTTFNKIRITLSGTGGGFYLDYFQLQSGIQQSTAETDPIATAKTVSVHPGYGILIPETQTQSLNDNPSHTPTVDTFAITTRDWLYKVVDSLPTGGGSETFEQVLTNGSDLTTDHTVDGTGVSLLFQNFDTLQFHAANYLTLSSDINLDVAATDTLNLLSSDYLLSKGVTANYLASTTAGWGYGSASDVEFGLQADATGIYGIGLNYTYDAKNKFLAIDTTNGKLSYTSVNASLNATYIGYGDGTNALTGSSSLIYNNNYVSIKRNDLINTSDDIASAGLLLVNETAAIQNRATFPPLLLFKGNGWYSIGNISYPSYWALQPRAGNGGNPGSDFYFTSGDNTTTLTERARITAGGNIIAAANLWAASGGTGALQANMWTGSSTGTMKLNVGSSGAFDLTIGANPVMYIFSNGNTIFQGRSNRKNALVPSDNSAMFTLQDNVTGNVGSVVTTAGTNTVPGTSTKFTHQFKVGDQITISDITFTVNETHTITAIASDVSLTVDANWTNSFSATNNFGNASAPVPVFVADYNGLVGIGSVPSSSSKAYLNLPAGTTNYAPIAMTTGVAPSTAMTNGVMLFAEDVAASAELKVIDEAGNVTVLSPHDFSGIPEGKSNPMAWSFYSERDGKYVNVDMFKLARLVEKLTGEKLIYTGDVHSKPNPENR